MLYDSYPSGTGPPPGSFPNSAWPFSLTSPSPSPNANPPLNPLSTNPIDYSDYGFRKTITFLQNPTVGTSFLALALFIMIAFASDVLFNSVTLTTLGITITLSVLAFTGLVILLLFLL